MEVPRLAVELELQPPAYAKATATRDPSRICDLHHSSWQHRILNPLSEARDRTRVLMDPSGVRNSEPQWQLPIVSIIKPWKIPVYKFIYSHLSPPN